MIEIRYKRILFFQTIFLIVLALFSYIALNSNYAPLTMISFWFGAIILNLAFIRQYALPSESLLKTISEVDSKEDLSWEEIEDTIAKKDVALLKQREEFELENLRYKLLLDSLEDPVCIFNKKLTLIYSNQAFIHLFGLFDKKFPLPLIEVTRNLDFQLFLEQSVKINGTSRKTYFSFHQIQDAHKNFFDLKVFPVDNSNNYLCLLHDVTERRMADQMREDFVANFSHEVRTPLTILNGQMQNLKMELEKDQLLDKYSAPIQKIENNSRRLINLFNDLLRLSSVETKKEIYKEKVDIEQMLDFLSQDLMLNYPEKKIDFLFDLRQKEVFVDYQLFEQIMINLIDNAIKYSGDVGQIRITCQRDQNGDHLSITNSGHSIPSEQLHRVFERFYRVDYSRSKEIEGTGLGLSIVKHIVQRHDGKIRVSSRNDCGTTFTLSFPAN
jgi:two-component system phosphate regulon sensor histidine kinase PhoR